ncbi:MAG: HAD family hydrolase [Streptosporangiaceae bacterium]|jgi:FMN phosphatase YigB (HAD superfamily)
MSDMPAILLDCDGVIVDNVAFERRVTDLIITAYADNARLTIEEATRGWQHELSQTKGHPSWYDYAFHCDRLGLDGKQVCERAHFQAAHLLTYVDGARESYRLMQEYGLQVGIVTDATSWVVDFKLDRLGLHSISFVFASNEALATKSSTSYWERLVSQYEYFDPLALVDNRQINLLAAKTLLPDLSLVQFEKQEHVMTLPLAQAPTSNGLYDNTVKIVHDHHELQHWLANKVA